jgi:alkanesulfonate monooxygenase SsuD/methylene tetrahydromethanopterin reductase-like flavin-dependent oxidoreductase (luciferase family)
MTAERKRTRKSLTVRDDEANSLVRSRDAGESEAVRDTAEFVRSAEEIVAAIKELHELGGIDDVFNNMPDEQDNHAGTSSSGRD